MCRSPEQFKIWSKNLGHENVLTTLTNYGEVSMARQKEVLSTMTPSVSHEDEHTKMLFDELVNNIKAQKMSR
jgi:hypothetical protein|tara:strand:+ start:232 stop:447 length:216 start_codon:yes stop_codon:yes gene_type:complete